MSPASPIRSSASNPPPPAPGSPPEVLDPRRAWPDAGLYDAQARRLAGLFVENFRKFEGVDPSILGAGPKAG